MSEIRMDSKAIPGGQIPISPEDAAFIEWFKQKRDEAEWATGGQLYAATYQTR